MLTFKISTIDHNTYYYCSMFIIPTTGQNPNWNSPVHIAFFKIPTAKIQLIIIPTTDQNPNRNFPVQIAFFIIPTSHNPYKVKSRTQLKSLRTQLKSLPTQLKSLLTQLKSLRTQLKSLQTQLKSLRVGIMIVGILIVGILKPSRKILTKIIGLEESNWNMAFANISHKLWHLYFREHLLIGF